MKLIDHARRSFLFFLGLLFVANLSGQSYEPDWESLKKYETPEWFRDAKFGIFIHWGPYAVPAFESEWYGFHMYREKSVSPTGDTLNEENSFYKHHIEKYGGAEEFGYKDFIPMFKGEKFDANKWIDLFQEAGARYVVPVAEHCDMFAMYDSKLTSWNSVNMGPKVDVVGELFKAARKKGMKAGLSSHTDYSWFWWHYEDKYDTSNPKYEDIYLKPHKFSDPISDEFKELWYDRIVDMLDQYSPDLIWFDFGFCKPDFVSHSKKIISHYYNQAEKNNPEGVVLNYKAISYNPVPDGVAVLDIENGKLDRIRDYPWQTDASTGGSQWGWSDTYISRSGSEIIHDLIDIVSKNGCLLLNIAPDAQGVISEDQVACLKEVGAWLKINGEAIYETRPFKTFGQGPSNAEVTLHSNLNAAEDFSFRDIRYTTKGDNLYAIMLGWPENPDKLQLNTLGSQQYILTEKIRKISVLNTAEELKWSQEADKLIIELPEKKPCENAVVFKIEMEEPPSAILNE